MKRFFKSSFFIILILVSLISSGTTVRPAYAQTAGNMQIVPLQLPDGWQYGYLHSIWGVDTNSVYAVGYGYDGSRSQPLLYVKTGNNWVASAEISLPEVWRSGILTGIWGSGTNNMFAVGYGYNNDAGATLPLIYRWNGSVWSLTSPSLPNGWKTGDLYGVWGSSASDVYAVGSVNNGTAAVPLLFHWNGSAWMAVNPLPQLPSGWSSGNLYGVWGSSSSNVYVVGSGNNGTANVPLIYQWNGSTWAPNTSFLPGGWKSGNFKGIWGIAGGDVYVVGSGNDGSQDVPLLYQGSGSTWTRTTLPTLSTGTKGYLYSVWGSSANDVYAVGNKFTGNADIPLLFHKTGSSWTEDSPSLPIGWRSENLYAVWGSSSTDVYTLGTGHNGSVYMPLLYHSSQAGDDLVVPGNVENFTAVPGATNGSIRLSWKAPADDHNDPNSGPVSSYVVKYSSSTFASWSSGAPVSSGIPTPAAPGTIQSMTITGLQAGTVYYFAIRAQDEQYNLSADFMTASATANVGNRLPGKVTLVSPSGTVTPAQPTYTWNANDDATWYYLWVNGPSGNVIQQWYTAAQANCNTTCSVTPATTLKGGAHTWWVRTWNEAGYGPWSDAKNFTRLLPPLPGQATLDSPNGTIGNNNPTYRWNEVTGSTWYYLWVNGSSGTVFKKWYTSAQANCNGSTCSIAGATPDLAGGNYTWWIQTWNEAGSGPWSTRMDFTAPTPILPGQVTLVTPEGNVTTSNPAYTWDEISEATWYYLWVNGPSGTVIEKWYSSAEAGCNGTTCSITGATPGLKSGTYNWWVRAWNSAGAGPWSDAMNFSLALPEKAILISPTGSSGTNNPTYTWNEVPSSTWYYLWVNGPNGNVIGQWYSTSQANCDGTTCSVIHPTTLSSGTHTWWIQTWNDAGKGPWSDAMEFTSP